MRPHRPVRPVVYFAQRTNLPIVNPRHHLAHRSVRIPRHKKRAYATSPRRLNHQLAFQQPVGNRFVHHHMLALLHRRNADHPVQMIGRHDLHSIDVFFFVQQFAKIRIRRTAMQMLIRPLLRVITVHHLFAYIQTSRNLPFARAPIRLAQKRTDIVTNSVRRPIPITQRMLFGSQTATILTCGDGSRFIISRTPSVPMPICAITIWSLGATKPFPNTCLGTIVRVEAAAARNVRRFWSVVDIKYSPQASYTFSRCNV